MDFTVIIASIVVFLAITFILVGMLLGVKARFNAIWACKAIYQWRNRR